jgi:hypothetical protein
MAFVCTLSSQSPLLPVVATYPTLTSLVYPIGYDDVDSRTYQLFISFGTAPGGIVEYAFCIVCTYQDGVAHDIWDSQVIASTIRKKHRALILALLIDATRSLIRSTQFPEITMHTFAHNLPQKALVKYRNIAQVFVDEGYTVRHEARRGQHVWWFERTPQITLRIPRRRRRRPRLSTE